MPFKIGGFEIRRELGQGATGTVYLAYDPFNEREVAVKVAFQDAFRDPANGPRLRRMFLNEAALAGKLHHPHIVALYDAGTDEDFHYIVMEYVPGGTLEAHCAANALLPYDRVAEIGFKCCQALDFAFRRGLIHRDIKPANILLAGGGDIKVSDFGAAVWVSAGRTQLTSIVGSPLYMSPEQIRGLPLTHQTDIYSLGVVLFQLLTGRAPYGADNEFALMQRILDDAPLPLRQLRPDVPPALAQIVERAMQKDAARRYRDWSDFARDLAEFATAREPDESDAADSYRFRALRRLPFFHEFTDAEVWEFLRISEWARFHTGRVLVEEERMGRSLFLLASGEGRVSKGGRLVGALAAGDCFGEMAYVYGEPRVRTATVTAVSEVVLVKVRAEALAAASEALQLRCNRAFLRLLADRLARTDALLATL